MRLLDSGRLLLEVFASNSFLRSDDLTLLERIDGDPPWSVTGTKERRYMNLRTAHSPNACGIARRSTATTTLRVAWRRRDPESRV